MAHQSMSGREAQSRIDQRAQAYAALIQSDVLTLQDAHQQLVTGNLDLFQIAGLAKALACFQCSAS